MPPLNYATKSLANQSGILERFSLVELQEIDQSYLYFLLIVYSITH